MRKRGIRIFVLILVTSIFFSFPMISESQGGNGVMGTGPGINNQGMLLSLLGASMSIPLDPIVSGLGAVPAAGMAMSPILGAGISPATGGLINDPFIAMNGMNILVQAAGTPMSLMRAAPYAPLA